MVPRSIAELPGPPVAVVELKQSLARTVAIFRVEGRYLSLAAEAFLRFAKECLSGKTGTGPR